MRGARDRAEQAAVEHRAECETAARRADELRAELAAIADAGPLRALRLRRAARAKLSEAA